MNRIIILVFLGALFALTSCHDRSQDVQIKKAAAIHLKSAAKHDSIKTVVLETRKMVEEKLSKEEIAANQQSYKAMIRSLDKSLYLLETWEEDLVGVPGLEHDHADHKHDHQNDDILDDMSDSEILELQKAYSDRMDQIEDKITEVIVTIQLYSQNATTTAQE